MPRVSRANGNSTQLSLASSASMYPSSTTTSLAMTLQRQTSSELPYARPGPLLLPFVGGKVMVPTAQDLAILRSRTGSAGGAASVRGSRAGSVPLDELLAAAAAAASLSSPFGSGARGGTTGGTAATTPGSTTTPAGGAGGVMQHITPRTSASGGVSSVGVGTGVSVGVGTQANGAAGGLGGMGRQVSSHFGSRPSLSPPASEFSPSPVKVGRTEIETQTGLQTTCEKSFYRRKLMAPSIPFSSNEGEAIFQDAFLAGYMRGFFKLIEQYNTQDEPAFCALASVAMVLNALSIDPRRVWKGPWRWFHEEMLDCCKPVELVKLEGMTLSQAACTAHCNGARVDLRMHGSFSLDEFRAAVKQSCASESEHMVLCYSRKALMQTGDGHFSPVGGYNPAKDMVLVLDVARFKYPPHWAPLPVLFDAMGYPDPETGKPRGYMRLSAQDKATSVLFTLDLGNPETWQAVQLFVHTTGPQWLRLLSSGFDPASPDADAPSVLTHLVDLIPIAAVAEFVVERPRKHHDGSCMGPTGGCMTCRAGSSQASRRQLQQELRSLPFHAAVKASKQLRAYAATLATAAAVPTAGGGKASMHNGEKNAAAGNLGGGGGGGSSSDGEGAPNGAAAAGSNGARHASRLGLDAQASVLGATVTAVGGYSPLSSDPSSTQGSRPGSSPGFTTALGPQGSPFSTPVRGHGANHAPLHASASASGTGTRTVTPHGGHGVGGLPARQSNRPSAAPGAAAAPRLDPETVLLKLADKVCVLLMTMLLRPATPSDQAAVAASPSPRLTFPAAAIMSLPLIPAPSQAASPRQPTVPPTPTASTAAPGGWDALLDISSSSLVEAEVLYMIHGLGLLEDMVRQGLYKPGTSWAPCEGCYSSLDCLEEGHLTVGEEPGAWGFGAAAEA